jgi:hypothetical protein
MSAQPVPTTPGGGSEAVYYRLNPDGTADPTTDILGAFASDRRVAWTTLHLPLPAQSERVEISTIFLVVDRNFSGEGPPIMWETMVFGGEFDTYHRRYTSHEAAKAGHEQIVAALNAGTNLDDIEVQP